MTDQSLEEILLFARKTAVRAGDDVLLKGFHDADKAVEKKGRFDLVTRFDRASEELIFSEIRSRFPEHAVVAEEGSRSDNGHDLLWYVDPLDATTNFAHGIPHFCVSIAVFSRSLNQTVVGVVYEPVRKELFSARRGGGSFLNDRQIQVSATDSVQDLLLATGFPYGKQDTRINNLAQLNAVLPQVRCIRRMGSAALDLCYVACGRIDGYWEPMLFPWDMAAGALLVEESGGLVTDYTGDRFDPERPEIIAANGEMHRWLAETVNQATAFLPRNIKP